jgi:protein-disulfide isomerase
MKRYLPFIIIAVVALLTVGAGTMLYRTKRPLLDAGATSKPVDKIAEKTAHIRGQDDALVTVEEFADFQCPSCSLVSGLLHQLEQEYKPRLRIVFRHFPLQMHSHAIEAAVAAEAAGRQGRFWEMHDLLYQNQSAWSKAANVQPLFETYAGNLGLDIERFKKDLQSREVNSRVAADSELGVSRGVKNTPTLFINGREVPAPFNRENLAQAIEAAMTANKNS